MSVTNPDPIALILFPFRLVRGLFFILVDIIQVIIGLFTWGRRKTGMIKAAITKELHCPKGCPPQPAEGVWTCSGCGASYTGWIWSACPACKMKTSYTDCIHCGMSIVNPEIK